MKEQIKGVMATAVILSMAFYLLFLTGCISEPEVCNYDSVCTDDETDNCVDCENYLGRDVNPDAEGDTSATGSGSLQT